MGQISVQVSGGFSQWNRNPLNVGNARFKVNVKSSLCYLSLVGSVVTFWSLTHEIAGSNNPFYRPPKLQEGNVFTGICLSFCSHWG